MDVKALIQNKGTGYWLCAAASACALVVGIIVLATQGMALTVDVAGQGWTVSVMLFIGFAVNIVLTFFPRAGCDSRSDQPSALPGRRFRHDDVLCDKHIHHRGALHSRMLLRANEERKSGALIPQRRTI